MPTYRRWGFIISAVVHLVPSTLLLSSWSLESSTQVKQDKSVAIDLSMFTPTAPVKKVVQKDETPVKQALPDSEPIPQQTVEAKTEPVVVKKAIKASASVKKKLYNPTIKKPEPKRKPKRILKSPPDANTTTRKINTHKELDSPPVKQQISETKATPSQSPKALNQFKKTVTSSIEYDHALSQQVRKDYLSRLRSAISGNKFYPKKSRRRREEETVIINLEIDKNGQFKHLKVTQSSGYARLDKAALETLRKTSNFAPLPLQITERHLSITIPIAYRLR